MSPAPELTRRDRAFAELVRAREWVNDAALDEVVAQVAGAGASGALEEALRSRGLITEDQAISIWQAIDGVEFSNPGNAPPSPDYDSGTATLKPGSSSNSEATLKPGSGKFSSSNDATLAPGSGTSSRNFRSGGTSGDGPKPGAQEKAGDQFGPYRLLRELGRGGMGVVYRALHVDLRREVALKVMLAGIAADDPDTERFRREAAMVAKLGRHPHLVQVHEIGREGDRLFFTMDYIDGRSAKQRTDEAGALPPRESAMIGAEIASALDFVHKAGMLHRDVKPHNVLIDAQGKAFLSDFGLAKDSSHGEGLTMSGTALGTPAYMSPEVAMGGAKKATPRSDVYALGATLYEMLTGRAPFTGVSGIDLLRAVADNDPATPRSLRPDLHPDLDVILQKSMAKEPERRYIDAGEMERDLRRWLNGEPIHARPAGLIEKWVRKARRHRALLAAGALAAAALITVSAWSITKWVKREKSRREAAATELSQVQQARKLYDEGRALIARAEDARIAGEVTRQTMFAGQGADALQRASGFRPADPDIRYELGRALQLAGKTKEALASLEEAVRLNPKHGLAWFEHGYIARRLWIPDQGLLDRTIYLARPNDAGYREVSKTRANLTPRQFNIEKGAEWREVARRDFERVLASGTAPERAAYGRAVLLSFEGKYAEALVELDAADRIDKYFVPALEAQADIRELSTGSVDAGLAWRSRLADLQPRNPAAVIEYARSLSALGRNEQARSLIVDVLKDSQSRYWLIMGGWAVLYSGGFEEAEQLGRRAIEFSPTLWERSQSAHLVVEALCFRRRFDEARDACLKYISTHDESSGWLRYGMIWADEGKFAEALKAYRRLPDKSQIAIVNAKAIAWAEWQCGNAHRAFDLERRAQKPGESGLNEAIYILELGEVATARIALEKVIAANPNSSGNYSNLAAAQFLSDDYPTAMETLKEGFMRSPVPDAMKTSAKKLFENLAKRAKETKTPEDAGKMVESLAAMVELAMMQHTASAESTGAAREALRGLWWVLQEYYWMHDMPAKSVIAGNRYLALRRDGRMLFKQARASAAEGKLDQAIRYLREAMEQGFDEAKRLDGEKAFDSVRDLDDYKALRGKCK